MAGWLESEVAKVDAIKIQASSMGAITSGLARGTGRG
jgi:hypothetical protein